MQLLLSSPEITCDHCIATIRGVAEGAGLAFVHGDPEARTFVLDVASGADLDRLAPALAEAGYPLGEIGARTVEAHHAAEGGLHPNLTPGWRPAAYRVEKSDVGANVNYDCYCGCDAGFALDRSQADQPVESCCCGNQVLVGPDAGERIGAKLDPDFRHRLDIQQVTMPWGQPMEVALAIPTGE